MIHAIEIISITKSLLSELIVRSLIILIVLPWKKVTPGVNLYLICWWVI